MRSKDPCGECPEGRMLVTCTRRILGGRLLKRFLKCTHCGHHGAEVLDAPHTRSGTNTPGNVATTGKMTT
jgi:hypothetical protein